MQFHIGLALILNITLNNVFIILKVFEAGENFGAIF